MAHLSNALHSWALAPLGPGVLRTGDQTRSFLGSSNVNYEVIGCSQREVRAGMTTRDVILAKKEIDEDGCDK